MLAQIPTSLGRRVSRQMLALVALAVLVPGCITETTRRGDNPASGDPAFDSMDNQPASPSTLHALARILASQGRDDECERVLEQIIQRDPDYVPAYSDLAELYLRRNHVDDAIKALSTGLARSPGNPVLLNNMGMCQLLKDDYGPALEMFTKASAANPKESLYLANQAMALGMLERYDEAAAIYRMILATPKEVRHNIEVLRNAHLRLRPQADRPVNAVQAPAASPSADPK